MDPEIVYDLDSEEFGIKIPGARHLVSDYVASKTGDPVIAQLGQEASLLNAEAIHLQYERHRQKHGICDRIIADMKMSERIQHGREVLDGVWPGWEDQI